MVDATLSTEQTGYLRAAVQRLRRQRRVHHCTSERCFSWTSFSRQLDSAENKFGILGRIPMLVMGAGALKSLTGSKHAINRDL